MDPMSAISSSAAVTQSQIGVLVLRKVLDIQAAQGAMMSQMLEQSAGLGTNLDVKA